MPEGPSIFILREEASIFNGQKVLSISGNTKTDVSHLAGKKILEIKSWGKHLLICFKGCFIRIHLLMFGSYRINERKENSPERLSLKFKNGELNFYTCSVKLIGQDPDEIYDWEVDTMSELWNPEKALKNLRSTKTEMICDALLDQDMFAGSGNIIKNEVLYIVRIHPETLIKSLPPRKLKEIIKVTREYCFDFYHWKKAFVLSKNWKVYKQKICDNCGGKIALKYTGKTKRRTFFCEHCQKLVVSTILSKKS